MIRDSIWRLRHPRWSRDAALTLRALGFDKPTRRRFLDSAADEFNVRHQPYRRHAAGCAVTMLATVGVVDPGAVRRHLRAIRMLDGVHVSTSAELICRCVASGRVLPDDYARLAAMVGPGRLGFDADDVRAGKVWANDLVWRLTA